MSPRRACYWVSLALTVSASSQAWAQEEAPAAVAESTDSAEPATPPPEKHYWRAALLEAVAIGGGTAWYWIDRERQVADWDFPSWRDRLTTDVMRYDNNPFHVNFAWHAGNGAGFHSIARANGLSLLESVGYGALTSIIWEYALEYREKVSINDLIFTSGAGLPLGEFIHVMGWYFNNDAEARQWSALRWTLGLPLAVTGALDNRPPADLSQQSALWHEFHLGYDLSLSAIQRQDAREDFALHSLHMDGRFVRMPGYREPGSWSRLFRRAEFTSATFDASGAAGGSAFKLFADATLLGHYGQNIREDSDNVSTASMLGVAMAYRYRREEVGRWDDKVGILHFPGLAAEAHLRWRDLHLDFRGRAHADFAGINALANADWEAAYPDEQGKAILRKMGYYYGYGASVSAQVEARYRHVVLGGKLWTGRYQSDEGLDRTQEDVTRDQESEDSILDTEMYLRLEGLPYRGYLGASYQYRERDGVLDEFSAQATLHRAALSLGLSL